MPIIRRTVALVELAILGALLLDAGALAGVRFVPADSTPQPGSLEDRGTSGPHSAPTVVAPGRGGPNLTGGNGGGHGVPPFRLETKSRASSACAADAGVTPAWLAFDPDNATFWVADPPSCVDVFELFPNGQLGGEATSIPVGSDPFGVAVDTVTNDVFVANSGSNNVTVISASTNTTLASIDVGTNPHGVCFDSASNDVYVANTGSDNVTVLSGTSLTVVGTVPVGVAPIGVVADPTNGQVFVANFGSANVTAISDATNSAVASIPTGNGSYGLAWDNASNEIFVTNEESDNISGIDAVHDSVIGAVPVVDSVQLQGLAYDPAAGQIWAGGGSSFAVVVNATANSLVGYAGTDPSGVAYDPVNGDVCVTNTANVTFECLDFRYVYPADALTFHETGLPVGYSWTVVLNSSFYPNATTQSSATSDISFGTLGDYWIRYEFRIPEPRGFVASPASGVEVLDGSPIVVDVSLTPGPGLYPVDFNETGLPSKTNWSVTLGTTTVSASTNVAGFVEQNGTYPFVVNSPAGFAASPGSGSVSVNGSDVPLAIAFSAIAIPLSANFTYQIQYESCLTDGGVTNFVILDALAAGGSPPYSYNWTLPTGSATTALSSTTTTYGQANTVTLIVSDAARRTATHSAVLPMDLLPCPPPALKSTTTAPLSVDQWAIISLAVVLVAVSGVAVWLARRGAGGPPGSR